MTGGPLRMVCLFGSQTRQNPRPRNDAILSGLDLRIATGSQRIPCLIAPSVGVKTGNDSIQQLRPRLGGQLQHFLCQGFERAGHGELQEL